MSHHWGNSSVSCFVLIQSQLSCCYGNCYVLYYHAQLFLCPQCTADREHGHSCNHAYERSHSHKGHKLPAATLVSCGLCVISSGLILIMLNMAHPILILKLLCFKPIDVHHFIMVTILQHASCCTCCGPHWPITREHTIVQNRRYMQPTLSSCFV